MSTPSKKDREKMTAFFSEVRKLFSTCPNPDVSNVLTSFIDQYEDNFYINQSDFWKVIKDSYPYDDHRQSINEQ